MIERPILFSAPMVRALLDGTKTQTRRPVTRLSGFGPITEFQASDTAGYAWMFRDKWALWNDISASQLLGCCPYGTPGDRLWVRETFQPMLAEGVDFRAANWETGEGYAPRYTATEGATEWIDPDDNISSACKPSIHMPRWASRITEEITGVRVERLQDISEADALAEGIQQLNGRFTFNGGLHESRTAVESFRALWEYINGAESWDANPWVWAVEFRRLP